MSDKLKPKCGRCRNRDIVKNQCSARNSEFYRESIDLIIKFTDGQGCDAFFSENDEENLAASEVDPKTKSILDDWD